MEAGKKRVLVIDDELPMRRYLRACLGGQNFEVFEAATGAEAIRQTASRMPDVILLDLGLPDMDGSEVASQVRGWTTTPIIVVSARDSEQYKVKVLDAGADDYLTKPFSFGELLARIRVALRRFERAAAPSAQTEFVVGDLRVDLVNRLVLLEGGEVHLTSTEYKLLATLVRHAGRVLTHSQLLKDVWGPGNASQTKYLHVYMGHLRAKLEKEPSHPRYLSTEPGVGYRLKVA